ncbi:MAG TPA: GNAT family N-acetyltransferase [Bacteroidia bacterium]|nr:GNAT family N-acetyltransferase [Bacteroidia bacterium]
MMKLAEVTDTPTRKKFIEAGKFIYKNDPDWVCHLDTDIEQVFDPKTNEYFSDGEAIRWVLEDGKGNLLGRVAAFYSRRNFAGQEHKIGGMGFFECVNDKKAAHTLMDACKNWLQSKGIDGMEGPVNFGERDKYWGLMVEGFKNPSYQENYNPLYYKELFESYGFEKIIEQLTSEMERGEFNYERFNKLGSRILANPRYTFKHFEKKNVQQFARDFVYIYNLAWQHHEGFTPLTYERMLQLMQGFMPIVVEDLIWFAYADGEPAGFYVNLVDVNQVFKKLKGKFNLWAKLKFMYYLKTSKINRVRGIAYGVNPKYHNLGLDTGMIMKFHEAIQTHPEVKYVEMAWIGDFNPKMHSLLQSLGARRSKVHYTYRLLF